MDLYVDVAFLRFLIITIELSVIKVVKFFPVLVRKKYTNFTSRYVALIGKGVLRKSLEC